jgi:hypothetical protein
MVGRKTRGIRRAEVGYVTTGDKARLKKLVKKHVDLSRR